MPAPIQYPFTPRLFKHVVALNQPGSPGLNGAYTIPDPDYKGVSGSLFTRQTLPIPIMLSKSESAVQMYLASMLFAATSTFKTECANHVGMGDTPADVVSKLASSVALPYFQAMTEPLHAIFVVVEGMDPGIYFDENQARQALLNSSNRLGFAIKGGPLAFLNAVTCFTSNGFHTGRDDPYLDWQIDIPSLQVGGPLRAASFPFPAHDLVTYGIVIPPSADSVAPIRGKELKDLAEKYFWLHDMTGARLPASSVPVDTAVPAAKPSASGSLKKLPSSAKRHPLAPIAAQPAKKLKAVSPVLQEAPAPSKKVESPPQPSASMASAASAPGPAKATAAASAP
ncbi:hypothetical protein CYLTODRAFT_495493, partial [Cylindrobasidium torrendii FP15055 ss-10]